MHHKKMSSLASIVLPILLGCGGPAWQPPPANERLDTEITADGTKFFVFLREYLRPDRRAGPAISDDRPGQGGSRGPMFAERGVEERLTLIMEATGYCREGFFELYREQTFDGFSVRGECREAASEADMEKFSDQSIPL